MKAVSDLLSEEPDVEIDHLDILPGPPYFEEDLENEIKHYAKNIFPSSIETQEVSNQIQFSYFLSLCYRSWS